MRLARVIAGPPDGPLLIFVHGWPELGLAWRAQIAHFSELGWRCVAPDLRGYGNSPVPDDPASYALEEIVGDLLEMHDDLGGAPAVWVGHDWGGPAVYSVAAHHRQRVRAVAGLCVPYLPAGFALDNLVPLVDRELYPEDRYPYGQWGYYRFYLEDFDRAAADFEADVAATVALMFRPGTARWVGRPARSADVVANGGWFGPARRAPAIPRDDVLLSPADFDAVVTGLTRNGFRGPNSWYVNDPANLAYAASAPDGGRLAMPVLMVHAEWDGICDTAQGPLAEPMRAACADLTEVTIKAGHQVQLESPVEVNAALQRWLGGLTRG